MLKDSRTFKYAEHSLNACSSAAVALRTLCIFLHNGVVTKIHKQDISFETWLYEEHSSFKMQFLYSFVLYCIVLYYIVLYCIVLFCTDCTVLYCITLCCTPLYCIV